MEDKEIVKLYWDRDEQAIKESKDKYTPYCYAIAQNILFNKEDTEETLNDTWLAAWNAIPPHHPLVLSTFLGKITRRLSFNKWRNKNAEKRGGGEVTLSFDELEGCIPDQHSIRSGLSENLLSDILNSFLAELKESDRKMFVCRYWYFDSIADICERFAFTPSKVKSMLSRTRKKLAAYLQKEGISV